MEPQLSSSGAGDVVRGRGGVRRWVGAYGDEEEGGEEGEGGDEGRTATRKEEGREEGVEHTPRWQLHAA